MPSITKESSPQIRKLIDVTLKNIRALKLLGESTEHWDTLIIYMIVSKLDQSTEREWEQHKCSLSVTDDSKIIKLDDLVKFLRQKADMLDTLSHSVSHKTNNTQNTQNKPSNSVAQKVHCHIATEKSGTNTNTKNNQTRKRLCVLCSAPHPLYSCQKFLDLNIQDRIQIVRKHRLCENCMNSPTHTANDCKYGPCRKCETKKHNTLICDHANASQVNKATVSLQLAAEAREATVPSDNSSNSSHSRGSAQSQSYSVQVGNETHMNTNTRSTFMEPSLLSTALVEVFDKNGNFHQVRAVLDNCSEKCLVTQSLCDKLGLQLVQSTIQIRGVGNSVAQSKYRCDMELRSLDKTFTTPIQCLVLPELTYNLPGHTLLRKDFFKYIPDNITLADPTFYESRKVNILIGVDRFWDLVVAGKIRLPNGPYLINTKLGWIIGGSVSGYTKQSSKYVNCNFTQTLDIQESIDMPSLDKQVRSFWELEELPISAKPVDSRSDDERACEEYFLHTMKRASEGRFVYAYRSNMNLICWVIHFHKLNDVLFIWRTGKTDNQSI
ncbi:putative peptidase (DUF1758) domain-containing protein [Phthorimaea operculella]|nr:putative peptidase (DUF1758) domain-containing protein [Phthorimaea operculella]